MTLHRSLTTLRDQNNNSIVLRGVNMGAWTIQFGYTQDITLSHFQNLANHGCNFLRFLVLPWGLVETSMPSNFGVPTTANIDSNWLTWLDNIVKWCSQVGIYVTFAVGDLSGIDGGTPGAGYSYPSWLVGSGTSIGTDPGANTFETQFYTPSNSKYNDARTAFKNFLSFIAARYASNQYFIMSLMNEPLWSVGQNNISWQSNYLSVINDQIATIRTSYAGVIIVDVPIPLYGSGITNPTATADTNVMWDCHPYWGYPGMAYSDWLYYAQTFTTPYKTNLGYPVMFGEYTEIDTATQLEAAAVQGVSNPESDSNFLANLQLIVTWMNNNGIPASNWLADEYLYGNIGGWHGLDSPTSSSTINIIFQGAVNGGGGIPLPFIENFANLNSWTIIDGTWTLISGGVQGSSTTEALMTAGDPSWTDYEIDAPITIAAAGEGSIVFRFQDSKNYYWAGLGLWGHQYSISKVVGGSYSEIAGSGASTDNIAGTYNLKIIAKGNTISLYVNEVLVLSITDTSFASGIIGLRTYNSTMQVANVNVSATPTTPTQTYIVNWVITPLSGDLPFTINFSGYLSRSNSNLETDVLMDNETIQLQIQTPGSNTWADTGVTTLTTSGPLGYTGYFTGSLPLTTPMFYPGAWQFRAHYPGNINKNLAGCEKTLKPTKKKNLNNINALLL